jgi:putative copper export protein
MSHHDSIHSERPPDKKPKAYPAFLLLVGVLFLLLLPLAGTLLLVSSESATEKEDAARAAFRTKTLTELQAADAAEASF